MISVDLRSLLGRLDRTCATALQNAAGLAVSRGHFEVAVEHFFVKLLEAGDSDFSLILAAKGVDRGGLLQAVQAALEDFRAGHSGKPVFSPLLTDLVQDAWMVASIDLGCRQVRSGAVLLAFLARPALYVTGRYGAAFEGLGREAVAKEFAALTRGSAAAEALQEVWTPELVVRASDGGPLSLGRVSVVALADPG